MLRKEYVKLCQAKLETDPRGQGKGKKELEKLANNSYCNFRQLSGRWYQRRNRNQSEPAKENGKTLLQLLQEKKAQFTFKHKINRFFRGLFSKKVAA